MTNTTTYEKDRHGFYIGLDLGQSKDYTALAVIEKVPVEAAPTEYRTSYLERVPLGTPYPKIVERMVSMMSEPSLGGEAALVVDATGVGRPVVDMFREAGLEFTAVSITSGSNVNYNDGYTYVPKHDLIAGLEVLLQSNQLQYGAELTQAPTLIKELLNFQRKINDNAHESFGAWREGTHDDLVLAWALAAWKATRKIIQLAPIPRSRNARY